MLAGNLRSGLGEIDLLVVDGRAVVAVEVKTRVGEDPMTGITAIKRRRMHEAVVRLEPRPHRIDVVGVRIDPAGVTIRRVRDIGRA